MTSSIVCDLILTRVLLPELRRAEHTMAMRGTDERHSVTTRGACATANSRCNQRRWVAMAKSLRTIKKSAAKSSVSRSKLRSAVRATSGASVTKSVAGSQKKVRSSAKQGAAKKPGANSKKKATAKAKSVSAFVRQPSIIRPLAGPDAWDDLESFFGPKTR
jgi:hypothetical protein